ncbi:hypothetical protein PR202_gb07377 [Eleusine coracana subsp. coracana]|uniref:RING-type E3 ubiquitin transferase n=1 Tax=Eleusine coracana subsp. coracana TaxID=191504 RepID=A0AAV5EBZ8_ELECO|nr:hypothetical protein PR202_gb07377 [Eleusine coracana subsp. coracana]
MSVGSKFHVSKLRPEHVSAYRQYEKEKIEKLLDEYIQQCSKMKVHGYNCRSVKCEKLVIENAHIAKGITELVSMHGVTKLVMGAAADKNYSREEVSRAVGDLISLDIPTPPASRSSISPLSEWDAPSRQCASNAIDGQIQDQWCDLLNPVSYHEQGAIDPNTNLFDKLEETFTESDKFQRKAFDESLRKQKEEEELTLFKKINQRKEVETALAKANEDIEVMKQEMDALKQDRDDIIDKFIKMSEQKAMLEKRVNEYDGTVKDLEDVVAANRSLIDSQQAEYEQMKHERDTALKDADELRKEKDKALSCSNLWNTEFSLSELKQATQDFCDTMKVGEGGFGRVYKGHLRNTTVAIKMLRSHNVQGQSQFQQEVVVLSKVRHPNLVTLIGTCSEASALGIGRAVEDALDKDELELLVDKSAGRWPFDQAKKLMLLGLHCVELSRRRRPDRMSDVWCVVEPLVKSALSVAPPSFGHRFEDQTPSYFLCPISQEVMRNPHIAADGFTYEAEVIKGWLDSGRNTSPMTKSRLAHQHLTPNHALRSAIQEYFQQQQ